MQTRHKLAGVMGATTALALVPAVHAYAHDTTSTTIARLGPTVAAGTLLRNATTTPLQRLDAYATWLQKVTAAVPDGTVLRGRARWLAQAEIAKAPRTSARLGALTGLTAAQQALVADIQAKLAHAVSQLKALLANAPAAGPKTAVRAALVTNDAVDPTSTHACAHRWDGQWIGHRDGFRHRDGDRFRR